uniref:WD repeat domain 1 n=1 Tax=Astyanax mexicanus TaxID=7994 RepID=A0A8B9K6V1_ASTMX
GSRYASAGADGQIFLYDGKTADKQGTLGGAKAHEGGIYAVCWSPDSTQLISASGDKTVKLWDVATGTAVTTFNLGSDVLDQQLGCLWQKDHLLSVSLSGYINYLDKNSPNRPLRVIKGHSKSIQCLTVHKEDGRSTGENEEISGKGHSNLVARMTVDESNRLVTCSMDDTIKNDFYGHHAKVVCLSWSPDNEHFASGGMDMMVYVWTVNDADKRIKIPDSHRLHHVSGLAWLDEHTLVTTSHDASVKQWTLKI